MVLSQESTDEIYQKILRGANLEILPPADLRTFLNALISYLNSGRVFTQKELAKKSSAWWKGFYPTDELSPEQAKWLYPRAVAIIAWFNYHSINRVKENFPQDVLTIMFYLIGRFSQNLGFSVLRIFEDLTQTGGGESKTVKNRREMMRPYLLLPIKDKDGEKKQNRKKRGFKAELVSTSGNACFSSSADFAESPKKKSKQPQFDVSVQSSTTEKFSGRMNSSSNSFYQVDPLFDANLAFLYDPDAFGDEKFDTDIDDHNNLDEEFELDDLKVFDKL